MRQKLKFAQAIVHDPELIILDEPTSGLDPEERESMLRRVQMLAQKTRMAVLLSTHILPDVQTICDTVVILARGRVQVADELQELSRPTSPSIQVRLLGPPDRFVQKLGEVGLAVEADSDGMLTVLGAEEQLSQRVWQTARECGVGVRSLTPSRNSLEEIFLNAVREQPDDSA